MIKHTIQSVTSGTHTHMYILGINAIKFISEADNIKTLMLTVQNQSTREGKGYVS